MFIQVVQGRAKDPAAVEAAVQRWESEVAPGAEGWLGSTWGTTDDGTAVAVVRFESEEAASRNSARPEQDAWWREVSALYDGEVTFHDCPQVVELLAGGSDSAGFVQIVQAHVTDMERARRMAVESESMMREHRPDIIGATVAFCPGDGTVTQTVAFTSEAEARRYEAMEVPEDVRAAMEEDMAMMQDMQFIDLHAPHFATAR